MKIRIMLVLFSTLSLASCNKLNMENYDKLETGMQYKEVINIIGKPDSCDEKLGARSCIWGTPEGTNIKAQFIKETAVLFSNEDLK